MKQSNCTFNDEAEQKFKLEGNVLNNKFNKLDRSRERQINKYLLNFNVQFDRKP